MLNANNKVNYEPKQKEKKYSLSTVLAWLYLKTIGRMLPEKWNQWAKSILHYNIADNVVQTDDLLNSNREKELKDENERLKEKLKEGSKKEENQSNLNQELTKKEKEITKLKEQVKSLGEEKEIFAKFFAAQAQQIEDLELENEELKSKLAGLKKNYSELVKIAQKRGEEFLAQFKEKSEEILHLQKELIECSKEFANKIETLSADIEEKDGKIVSFTKFNEVLEQEKKEMENKNNAQQQTIFTKDQKIKEQDDLINSFRENKDINQTVKKENKSLRAQNTELKSKFSKLNNESDTKIKELKNQLEEKQAELEQAKEKDAEVENLKQQLEKEKTNLNTIEKEKKELESEVDKLQEKSQKLEESNVEIKKQKADLEGKLKSSQEENKKLQEQVQTLEKGKEWESAGIDDSLKQTSAKKEKQIEQLQEERKQAEYQAKADITKPQEEKRGLLVKIDSLKENLSVAQEQLQKQLKLNNQELLELKKEKRNVDTKLEDMDKKTKEVDAISIASTTKKTLFHSMKSSFSNGSYDLFSNKKLKEFLSHKNRELKKGFPELEGKHFCHNVLGETIKSLSNQSDGKFESNKLLELLKNNLKKLASEIIEAEVKGVVKKYCNIGNIDKELRDGVLKGKLLLSIKKCMKNLSWDEEAANAITDSVLNNFHSKDNSNLQEIVSEELIKGRMEFFSSNIELLQLASSIRDKFLSPDQKMCVQTSKENNEYELTDKAKKEYTPNSSMSHTNSTPVSVKQEARSR
ncbi:chromosome segregation protein SMC [Wolbachia endosymbiont wPip_Mol of Culex molestus]|uniref:hypothetical protein n=2 Tax=unclassified Wolbachia TaxID=2640676 RepID=UPI0003B04F91|nr:hypothetical protein [Wolbachia endosymbiont of Culex molestus]CQD06765.1 chromosome segregation protein SMC [Wolbachia endosymbiont wPip_Mol of Culex molestus]